MTMTPNPDAELAGLLAAKQLAADVDALGDIERQLAPHRLAIAREEALRKAIRGYFDDAPVLASFDARGERFTAVVGARAEERAICYPKLIKSIGIAAFKKIATVTLKALEAEVSPGVIEACVSREYSGWRSLKVFECAKAAD